MSHPIRLQQIGQFRCYRMGETLIAEKGDKRFVIMKYSCGSGFEASVRSRDGVRMAIKGDVFPTRRDAAAYLLSDYLAA